MNQQSIYQQVRSHLAYLRLPAAAEALPGELERAQRDKLTHTAFLDKLLGIEVTATEQRRLAARPRLAPLPGPWRLDEFDFDAQPSLDRKLVDDLATLRFVAEAGNVLLVGPPGVGKTMLAVCLGRLAAEAGYRVHFTSAADVAARCHRAAIEGRWATTMRFYAGPQLLIIDELGYLPMKSEAAAALFQVITQRYLKGSVILTTNRAIGPAWAQIFDDPMVAAALLDRLLHRAAVLQIDGDSYRMRAHRARIEHQRRSMQTSTPDVLREVPTASAGVGQYVGEEVLPPTT